MDPKKYPCLWLEDPYGEVIAVTKAAIPIGTIKYRAGDPRPRMRPPVPGGAYPRRFAGSGRFVLQAFFLVFALVRLSAQDISVSPEGRPLRSRAIAEAEVPARHSGAGQDMRELQIPGLEQPRSQEYLARYTARTGRRWLEQVMRDAAPWLPFVREEIARRGLPPELLYLPVIESSYKPTALSRSGAAGIWQFMRNSISPFGIHINYWVDERFDFWKSTLGALEKLEENYRELGDWPLALAAYNIGMGAMRRIIRQGGTRDYWALAARNLLGTDCAHYVPKFLAVAFILSNPRHFGLEPRWEEEPRWVRIRAGRHVDLRRLAGEAGIDTAAFLAANAECVHGITPADDWYYIKTTAADADAVEAVLAGSAEISPVFPRIHVVQQGESLWGIGRRYGITPQDLAGANGMRVDDILRTGRTLNIPIIER